jgi:hypothetical protein
MPKRQPVGRPKKKLAPAKALVTRRIRRLVDLAHDGNVREASVRSGVAYATLRDLYLGLTTNPSVGTLEALASAYAFSTAWLLDEKQGDEVPMAGWIGYLPPFPELEKREQWPRQYRYERAVVIPFTASPLVRVAELLDRYLSSLPPSPDRPIMGDATDDKEMTLRLTTFLFQPLIAAKEAGEPNALLEMVPYAPDPIPTRADEEAWVKRLKELGRFWEKMLPTLIDAAQRHERKEGAKVR